VQNLNRKEFELAVLEREVQSNRDMLSLFINRAKETSAASDLQSTIARIVDRVRGDIATSGKYLVPADTSLIPDRLLDAALALIVMRFMSRPAAAVIDDAAGTRAKAAAAAERLLERVAQGNFAIQDPDSGAEPSGSAISTVSSNTRHFTRDKLRGL
jgi:hypothetical protein